MNNKTLETLQRTKVRLQSCLEVDTSLNVYQKAEIRDIVELVDRILDETSQASDAS